MELLALLPSTHPPTLHPCLPASRQVPEGPRTEATLCNNIAVCIRYMAAWIGGNGCVPLYNLMEDAATAEISRAQVGAPACLPLVVCPLHPSRAAPVPLCWERRGRDGASH